MIRAVLCVGVLCVASLGEACGQVGVVEFVSKGRGDTLQGRRPRAREFLLNEDPRRVRPHAGANEWTVRLPAIRGGDRILFAFSGGATICEVSLPASGAPLIPGLGRGGTIGLDGVFSSDATSVRLFSAAGSSALFGAGADETRGSDGAGGALAGGGLRPLSVPGVAIVPTNFSRPMLRRAGGFDFPEPRVYLPAAGAIAAGALGVGVIVRVRRG